MENKIISMSNINDFSLQEIFEYVSNHLLKQNRKSYKEKQLFSGCRYKHNYLRCAAGCLISDEEYNSEFEGKNFEYVFRNYFNHINLKSVELITKLQDIHDLSKPEEWKYNLIELGKSNHLNVEFLNKL